MTESAAMKDFASQIKDLIEARGLSLTTAAVEIGMDRGNLSRILNGKERVTLDRAEIIASRLGVELCVKLRKKQKISDA